MDKSLTIAFITSRAEPRVDWFLSSLLNQLDAKDQSAINILIVDAFHGQRAGLTVENGQWGAIALTYPLRITTVAPKPTIWQGKHRLTKDDWWAMSSATNTAFCLCKTDWVACVDDRLVLMPGWLRCIQDAMQHGYAVCGSYEKVRDLEVVGGIVKAFTPTDGKDSRVGNPNGPVKAPGEWFFGCNFALPIEWALAVNGCDETCDGLSMQDVIFGLMLQNNGYPICYDRRMKIMEDRTPDKLGPTMIRRDKGVSPDDKSHAMLAMLRNLKQAAHQWNLREIRERVLAGEPFPIPDGPKFDWYDSQPIADMA